MSKLTEVEQLKQWEQNPIIIAVDDDIGRLKQQPQPRHFSIHAHLHLHEQESAPFVNPMFDEYGRNMHSWQVHPIHAVIGIGFVFCVLCMLFVLAVR